MGRDVNALTDLHLQSYVHGDDWFYTDVSVNQAVTAAAGLDSSWRGLSLALETLDHSAWLEPARRSWGQGPCLISLYGYVCLPSCQPGTYIVGMPMQGLSALLLAIMAAGEVETLDARCPRLAHQAIAALARRKTPGAKAVLTRFGVDVMTTPDPEVGLRVAGLTRATWQAVAAGLLKPHEKGHNAWYSMSKAARVSLRRQLEHVSVAEAEAIYCVGADWATSSTARKYSPTAD